MMNKLSIRTKLILLIAFAILAMVSVAQFNCYIYMKP